MLFRSHWLEAQGVPIPTARLLEQLSDRLAKPGSGEQSLAAGWRLCWDRSTLVVLHAAAHGEERHGPIEPGK